MKSVAEQVVVVITTVRDSWGVKLAFYSFHLFEPAFNPSSESISLFKLRTSSLCLSLSSAAAVEEFGSLLIQYPVDEK
jgi:hypothetical protein